MDFMDFMDLMDFMDRMDRMDLMDLMDLSFCDRPVGRLALAPDFNPGCVQPNRSPPCRGGCK